MLDIKNLKISVNGNELINGLDLHIKPKEVHIIMGPNGTGKSSLSHAIAGRNGYDISDGTIEFCGKNILEMSVDERAKAGIFLAFQYPVEIPGISIVNFLRTSINSIRKANGVEEIDPTSFLKEIKEKARELFSDAGIINRYLNDGFSGGEKKRLELLQMLMLKPKFVILDEIDSGLDIDGIKIATEVIAKMQNEGTAFLIITHYPKLLDYINYDKIHLLQNGRITKSGGKEIVNEIELQGYDK